MFAPRRIGKGGEFLELAAAPLAHRIGERIVMVAEEQERRHACALLAHEQQRDLRSEHLQRNRSFERAGIAQHGEALAEGAVSDLIVILQKEHEGGRRKIRARRAARLAVTMLRRLALIDEAFRQAPGELAGRIVDVIDIIALVLSGEQNVQHVMGIVVPLGVEIAAQVACDIAVVLEHEMNMASGSRRWRGPALPSRRANPLR